MKELTCNHLYVSVCVNVLRKFEEKFPDVKEKSTDDIETAFQKFCKTAKDKDERFVSYKTFCDSSCYFLHSL